MHTNRAHVPAAAGSCHCNLSTTENVHLTASCANISILLHSSCFGKHSFLFPPTLFPPHIYISAPPFTRPPLSTQYKGSVKAKAILKGDKLV